MRLEHNFSRAGGTGLRICQLSEFESPVWKDAVERSLVTLKALSYQPTGVMSGAHDLPARGIGGVRNWDYRYCWIRDATLTYMLHECRYFEEAGAFREWLLRAAAAT